ncbi:hypothetical protein OPV22_029339 [Ensete ventricosum]|uniref:Uncharacterized protein n=1 Tax=Ensete ventricosum TaxID=4639 RepID=A0AAV8P4X6_ENSVE|nr:hypothetical protein OPV22_029339 [Ensete ventricosum]
MSKRSIFFSLLFSLSLSAAAQQDEFTYIGFSGGANGGGSKISLNGVAEVSFTVCSFGGVKTIPSSQTAELFT